MDGERPAEDLYGDLKSPIRLSRRGTKPKTARMKQVLQLLGITNKAYVQWMGGQAFKEFSEACPLWTQRSWEIMIIENLWSLKQWQRDVTEVE